MAHSIAAFFRGFQDLDAGLREEVAVALLGGIANRRFSEYYSIWVLHLFSQSSHWNHADTLRGSGAPRVRVAGSGVGSVSVYRLCLVPFANSDPNGHKSDGRR